MTDDTSTSDTAAPAGAIVPLGLPAPPAGFFDPRPARVDEAAVMDAARVLDAFFQVVTPNGDPEAVVHLDVVRRCWAEISSVLAHVQARQGSNRSEGP